jgi:hypothetical protein
MEEDEDEGEERSEGDLRQSHTYGCAVGSHEAMRSAYIGPGVV